MRALLAVIVFAATAEAVLRCTGQHSINCNSHSDTNIQNEEEVLALPQQQRQVRVVVVREHQATEVHHHQQGHSRRTQQAAMAVALHLDRLTRPGALAISNPRRAALLVVAGSSIITHRCIIHNLVRLEALSGSTPMICRAMTNAGALVHPKNLQAGNHRNNTSKISSAERLNNRSNKGMTRLPSLSKWRRTGRSRLGRLTYCGEVDESSERSTAEVKRLDRGQVEAPTCGGDNHRRIPTAHQK